MKNPNVFYPSYYDWLYLLQQHYLYYDKANLSLEHPPALYIFYSINKLHYPITQNKIPYKVAIVFEVQHFPFQLLYPPNDIYKVCYRQDTVAFELAQYIYK